MTANYKSFKPKVKDYKDKKYFNGECFICEKVGHRARDCRNKDKKTQRNSKVATVQDTGQHEEAFVLRASEWRPHCVSNRRVFSWTAVLLPTS
uniref:CCHC-type domain-containing protein n=1 Tax=Knipowitschia caucasica TaxID=637954 RepID=A0AAV2MHL1_KNICA